MDSRNTADIDRMFEQMDRTVAEIRRRLLGEDSWATGSDRASLWGADERAGHAGPTSAHTRLSETEDGYVFVADLPGFEREDIDLTAFDGALSISASRDVTEGDAVRTRRVD